MLSLGSLWIACKASCTYASFLVNCIVLKRVIKRKVEVVMWMWLGGALACLAHSLIHHVIHLFIPALSDMKMKIGRESNFDIDSSL